MDLPTQKHCVNTAYTCLKLLQRSSGLDKTTLLKAALLHDCGKKAGEITTWHRVVIVLVNRICPFLCGYYQKKGKYKVKGSLARAFYIQSIHSKRGAHFARQLSIDNGVIELIKQHHSKNFTNNLELQLLQQSDNLN